MEPALDQDQLLAPSVAARELGVHRRTLSRWAAAGRLQANRTTGGQRRYLQTEVQALQEEQRRTETDVVRLYDQGWSITQVADRFGLGYSKTRRILQQNTTLRSRSGRPAD